MKNLHRLFGIPAAATDLPYKAISAGASRESIPLHALPSRQRKSPREASAIFGNDNQIVQMTRDQIALVPAAERSAAMKTAYAELGLRAMSQLRKCMADPLAYGFLRGMKMPDVSDLYALSLHQDPHVNDAHPPIFMLTSGELRELTQHVRPALLNLVARDPKACTDMGAAARHNLDIVDTLCARKPDTTLRVRPR